jgi:outer membrane protein assembly factor BamB
MDKKLMIATLALALPAHTTLAADKPFPERVPVLDGSYHEGFAIGRGTTAYSGSPDGSIYKVDLRSAQGEVLVAPKPNFDVINECYKLGMRVDPRSNYLHVAGCIQGNFMVFDAETGTKIMDYQLAPEFSTVINDLVITTDAVFVTDYGQPYLYRLPLSANGRLPAATDVTAIPLSGDIVSDDPSCCRGNGIVATPDGKTLIVGNSNNAQLYRVDPASGRTDRIVVDTPLVGFIDGIILHQGKLYILTPDGDGSGEDWVQVVALDKEMLTGTLVGIITDPDMDGVASGAMFGNSLYVNNGRYYNFPAPENEYWITKLDINDVQPR